MKPLGSDTKSGMFRKNSDWFGMILIHSKFNLLLSLNFYITGIFLFASHFNLNTTFIILLTNRNEEHRQDEANKINDPHFLKFRKLVNEEFFDQRRQ